MGTKSGTSVELEQETFQKIFLGLAVEAQKQIPANLPNNRKKVIIIAGPTGCGKSELSLELAKLIQGEVISGDAMQVYRGMDIGTAKLLETQRQDIPHYLIDIRHLNEPFNVVDFYYEARHACQTIQGREGMPLVVGGSGFYLHSLIYGPPSGPPSVPELRKSLEADMERLGSEALFRRLEQLDLEYARTITQNDKQKIIRALEIIQLTGKKVSKLSWKGRHKPMNYDFRCWFLHRPKEILYDRIEKRCDKMLEAGFVDEVIALEKEGLRENPSASQAIGYRQVLDYLASPRTPHDYTTLVEAFKKASRHYAKRQFTWFRQEPLFRWIDLETHDPEVVLDIIQQDLKT